MFDVILDRDGILNKDKGYTYRIEDCELVDKIIEALMVLQKNGARFSIATGQSGIGRGKYTMDAMSRFHEHLFKKFQHPYGINFAAVAVCPHHPDDNCSCRKPKTGMLEQIETQLGPIDWESAWGIGDKPADAEMILAKGGRSVLIKSPYWNNNDPVVKDLRFNRRNFITNSVLRAAFIILDNQVA